MSAPMKRTRHPGIFKRGSRYVVTYRVAAKQKRESLPTLKAALRVKRAREADRDRGEYQEESRLAFREYAAEWIVRYPGNGRRGFTEETRAEYRRDLDHYLLPFFADRLGRTVSRITPRDVANWVAWLCDADAQGRELAPATVRRILTVLRSCLATARREGLIRHNPADGAVVPHREEVEAVGEGGRREVRVFTREQLDAVLRVVHPHHRAMFLLLAGTGLRWGEVAALRRGDMALDGSYARLRVRRSVTKGGRFKPPKTQYGRRDIPLSPALVRELRAHLAALPPGDANALAFPSKAGTPLGYPNALRRVLRPAAEEAGASWAAFHTFRHTFASLHLAAGTNVLQLSRLMGHHSAAFTLRKYAHLIPGDEPAALDLKAELRAGPIAGQERLPTKREPATA